MWPHAGNNRKWSWPNHRQSTTPFYAFTLRPHLARKWSYQTLHGRRRWADDGTPASWGREEDSKPPGFQGQLSWKSVPTKKQCRLLSPGDPLLPMLILVEITSELSFLEWESRRYFYETYTETTVWLLNSENWKCCGKLPQKASCTWNVQISKWRCENPDSYVHIPKLLVTVTPALPNTSSRCL